MTIRTKLTYLARFMLHMSDDNFTFSARPSGHFLHGGDQNDSGMDRSFQASALLIQFCIVSSKVAVLFSRCIWSYFGIVYNIYNYGLIGFHTIVVKFLAVGEMSYPHGYHDNVNFCSWITQIIQVFITHTFFIFLGLKIRYRTF